MPDLSKTFDAIDTELAGLLSDDNTEAKPTTVAMTPDQFLAYVGEQIKLAKADVDPRPRVEALKQVVALAKAYAWESSDPFNVPVYSGDLSRQAQSADAERIADHPGKGLGTGVEQGAPSGAFAGAAGPTGPASNTASPEQRIMPPAFPQSTPTASSQGFMAKAAQVLAKADNGEALLAELGAMLDQEAEAGDGDAVATDSRDDGWPLDLASESFLDGKQVPPADNFGVDPNGLGRGKTVD